MGILVAAVRIIGIRKKGNILVRSIRILWIKLKLYPKVLIGHNK